MSSIKKILFMSTWIRIVPGIKDAFVRFPMSFIIAVAASIVAILAIHEIKINSQEFTTRLLVCLGYGGVALVSLKLFVESKSWSILLHAIAALVVMAVVFYYAWYIFDESSISASVYFASALSLSLLFAPYINRKSDQPSVWYFNYQSGVAVFFAGLAALVMGVGVAVILSSLNYLFDFKIPSRLYEDVWIVCWGVFFPVYILTNISRQFDYTTQSCGFPKGIRFITNYILLPLMLIYMAILYVYFARITVEWELPRGRLTWMIAVFGSVGIVTKLVAYPIRNSGTWLLAWFDKYYYYALIVPIILLAIAIGVRIGDYGVTEQRYTVVLMAVWFSCVVLLSTIRRERFHIKYVPMTLAVLLLVGSYGPWSAEEVSINSQVSRFQSLLSKHHLLENGQVVKAKTDISFEDRKALSSVADYLSANEKRFGRVRPWFNTLLADAGKKETEQCFKLGGSGLVQLMGFNYINRWQAEKHNERFDYSNYIFGYNNDVIDVSDFDYIGHGSIYQSSSRSYESTFHIQGKTIQDTVSVRQSGNQLIAKTNAGETVTFDIGELVRELRRQNIITIKPEDKKKLSMDANSTNGRLKARLLLERLSGAVSANQEVQITSIQYYLMLRIVM